MENKKTIFKFFTIFQYRQEEEFLGMMHEGGLETDLDNISRFLSF